MRHKMVNLCPTTYEIASKMPNFSKWIRQKILEEQAEKEEKEQNYTKYRCPACWNVFVDRHNFGSMSCMNKDCGYTKNLEAIE